jgi:hypothetical protein
MMKDKKELSGKAGEYERAKEIIRQAVSELDLGALLKNIVKIELAKLRGKVE